MSTWEFYGEEMENELNPLQIASENLTAKIENAQLYKKGGLGLVWIENIDGEQILAIDIVLTF